VEDCINAARYLEKRGDVDGRRMAIRGGSAGGYTTLCALVFHNVFAAGASYFGVADLEELAKDTHKFESRYTMDWSGPIRKRPNFTAKRSPVHFADRLSCPVILLQGLEDRVVPPSQAEHMICRPASQARAFRLRRIPYRRPWLSAKATNIRRSVEAELYFYSRIFWIYSSGLHCPVEIENL